MISEAFEEKSRLLDGIKELLFKIEEEIKEIGVPFALQILQLNSNLPKQLQQAQTLWNGLQHLRALMEEEKRRLFAESFEMYKEEQESLTSESSDQLPHWIHSIFDTKNDPSFTEDSSFTTAAISHLDAAIDQLDPFYPTLSSSLAKIESAHAILKGRLEIFKVEYETLWRDIGVLSSKLQPFAPEEIRHVETECESILSNTNTDVSISRSCLRRVLGEWRKIEKERTESISGSILLIGRLWNLLETPSEERFPLSVQNLSLDNKTRLSNERNRLINFQQQKFKELYDAQVLELKKLMDALKWRNAKQEAVLSNCQSYTADGLQYLSCQLAILQPKLDLSLQIIASISARIALIAKMREFEKSASDPARLFRSSFQLLQEERFRKTALPSLLSLESQLKTQLNEYKTKFDEEFFYEDFESVYISVLEEEIAGRFMSAGIFGFDQSKQRKERQNSTTTGTNGVPRYTGSNTTNPPVIATNNPSGTANRKIPNLPQRRKLDK